MRKISALFLCILLALSSVCAMASETPGLPFDLPGDSERGSSDSVSAVSEAVLVNIRGQSVTLDFDPSAEFSYTSNGLIQASFYAYGPDGQYLYEMYMTFPETVSAGTVFTQDLAIQAGLTECSVVMLISNENMEDLYVAAQYNNGPYPEGTSYAIRFDSVTDTAGGRCFSGAVSATMSGEDINGAVIPEKLVITEAPFSFTMPGNSAAGQPYSGAVPPSPATPAPTPTVRPDMFRI